MDMLRMDDLTQMRLMQKELTKMRKAKDKQKRAQILAQSNQRKQLQSQLEGVRPMSGMVGSITQGVLNGGPTPGGAGAAG